MSTALEKTTPFKNLLGYGTVLDEKGRPMHKSWGNMIEFNEAADTIGVDVIRWLYVRQDPTKNLLFGYRAGDEMKRTFHLPLWNSVRFFLTYAELDAWKKSTTPSPDTLSILDRWILSRTVTTVETIHRSLSRFDPYTASRSLEELVTDISTWYIRQSRSRVWNNSEDLADKNSLYSTLYTVLDMVITTTSVFLPFFSEELHYALGHTQSVHLSQWPAPPRVWREPGLNQDMNAVRLLAEKGHSFRKENGLKVRQRLSLAQCFLPKEYFLHDPTSYAYILETELNVASVTFTNTDEATPRVTIDTTMTPQLEREGKVRDIIRAIQQKRKELGCAVTDYVTVTIPELETEDQQTIAKRVLASTVHTHSLSTVIVEKQ